jgi:hypothetical protein
LLAAVVQHKRIGKVIVATEGDEVPALRKIKAQAEANGVRDLKELAAVCAGLAYNTLLIFVWCFSINQDKTKWQYRCTHFRLVTQFESESALHCPDPRRGLITM